MAEAEVSTMATTAEMAGRLSEALARDGSSFGGFPHPESILAYSAQDFGELQFSAIGRKGESTSAL